MDNKKMENDASKVDEAKEKKETAARHDNKSYPSDWTLNTITGMWNNKHANTIMITGKF